MIKKILMSIALVMGMAVTAFAGPREEVTEMANIMQAICPMEIGDGISIENVMLYEDNVIMVMGMPIPPETLSQMQPMIPMLKGEMLKGLQQSNKDTKDFLKNIKAMGGNLIISIVSNQGNGDPLVITFTNSEL